jgi:hypothetical protein
MKLKDLCEILTEHCINNDFYHDEENKLTISVIDPSKHKYIKHSSYYANHEHSNELIIRGSVNEYKHRVIADIKHFILANKLKVERPKSLLAKISKLPYESERKTYQQSDSGSKTLSEINQYGFEVTDEWIAWNEYIPIKSISYKGRIVKVNGDELKKLGYGIKSFKVRNDRTLKHGIYCYGLHPNLKGSLKQNSNGSQFCAESDTEDKVVNLNNLIYTKALLSQANLNHPYNPDFHMKRLEKFI